jgi:adenylyl cyclase-associated protein
VKTISQRMVAHTVSRNPAAITWAKSFIALIDSLQSYVKQWHTTGVTWNPKVGTRSS